MTTQFRISQRCQGRCWSNDRLPGGLSTDFAVTRWAGTESEQTVTATVYECVGEVDADGFKIPNSPTTFAASIEDKHHSYTHFGVTDLNSAIAHALIYAGGGPRLVWHTRASGLA